jgi:hypothetical protein
VAGASNGLISASKFRSYVVSCVVSEAVTYSASHIDSVTIGCLLDSQAIGVSAPKNKYPLVDLQVEISPA